MVKGSHTLHTFVSNMENTDHTIYIVVFGASHEDKAIFADFQMASTKLRKQHAHAVDFSPFIEVRTVKDGVYYQNKYGYTVNQAGEVVMSEC